MNVFEELKWRGLFQDCSDEKGLSSLKSGDGFYVGIDPSAPALQLGNLVPIIVAIHLARAGFSPIVLFGGSTGAIGDPSGKSSERRLLDRAEIDANIEQHKAKVNEIFGRAGIEARYVNNLDWTKDLSVLEFLREIGKHFTVNYMIAKEVVKTRLAADGISFTEFSYMLLQAFDFYTLHHSLNCKLQIGGSDQWGNITAGLELIRRKGGGDAYAFSIPLVTDSQGKKFGKSESGALWLDAERTSPYRFHQFWLNVADSLVMQFLRIFTFLDRLKLEELSESLKSSPESRAAQRALADSVCSLVHGEKAAHDAARCAEVLFGGSLEGLSAAQLGEIFHDSPSSTMSAAKLGERSFLDLLSETGLAKSKSEARRLVQNGGAYLNNRRISDPEQRIGAADRLDAGIIVLRSGKKNYHLLKVE